MPTNPYRGLISKVPKQIFAALYTNPPTSGGGGSIFSAAGIIAASTQFKFAALGCGTGVAGEYAMMFATTLATGEAAGVGGVAVLANACAIGAWQGYANTVVSYSGDAAGGVTNAKSFLGKYNEFTPME